jgi:cytosine deaminase
MSSWLESLAPIENGAGWITGARVAACLLPAAVAAEAAQDRDGFALVDLAIGAGVITDVVPSGPNPHKSLALAGRQLWPGFVDIHTHLDKGHIWPRSPNPDGSHPGAARTVAADRAAHWTEAGIAARFDFGLRCAWAHGTAAIRTHIDSYVIAEARRSWAVFEEMRAAWAGRMVVQGVVMARVDQYAGEDADELVALASRSGSCLGGILRTAAFADPEPIERIDACLDAMLGRAAAAGLDVDLHIDENGDAHAEGLRAVARAVLRNRFPGRVNCGHCCALSIQTAELLEATIALAGEAGLSVTSLPMANLYLQDRTAGRTPRWRGIAPVHELAAGGVPVCASSDNCRDPFFMFGDHDMLETWREFVRIAHLDLAPGQWAASITRQPADVMGLSDLGRIEPGARADLVAFRARTVSELLARPQADRIVLRRGRPSAATLPDHAELDRLFDPTFPGPAGGISSL